MTVLDEAIKQGIVPAIIVAIYLIITKIIDSRKESTQIKLNNELVKSINKISDYICHLTKNIVDKDKEKCKIAIEDSMYSSSMRIINFVSNTIINNHIDTNKQNILANIHNIVNTEFYTIYSTLSLYTINNNKVCNYLDKEWMNIIEKDIIDIIYNTNLSKENKICSFINKLNFNFQTYITNIIKDAIKN